MNNSIYNFDDPNSDDEVVQTNILPRKKKKKILVKLIFICVIIFALISGSQLMLKHYNAKTFPDIPAGKYWGLLTESLDSLKAGSIIFIERSEKEDVIFLSFINDELSSSLEIPLNYSTIQPNGAFTAISVDLDGKQLKLTGQRGEKNDFVGSIIDSSNGSTSNW
ncbi:MAG: hypothetical protein KDD56_06295, partial [Bdellovibrionales bacterium]|nr:hypothetical protein [Bdellovibrionales bacterium]